jgi:hypothetical protein
MADDFIHKPTTIPLSAGRTQEQASSRVIEKRLREQARRGDAIAGDVLYETAYKGCKPATWGTFRVHISNLNKRLKAEGLELASTVHYRLIDRRKK